MYSLGQAVYSKNGRDKGKAFLVVGIEGEYLLLADGKCRKLEKPKKKKQIHVQRINRVDLDVKEKLEKEEYLLDADLRKALKRLGLNQ